MKMIIFSPLQPQPAPIFQHQLEQVETHIAHELLQPPSAHIVPPPFPAQ